MKSTYSLLKIYLFVILFAVTINESHATIHHVPATYVYIQDAIDAAAEGDTVLIAPGFYYQGFTISEANILVTSEYLFSGDVEDRDGTLIMRDLVNDSNYRATISAGMDSTTRVYGLTFTDREGGIYCEESGPKIEACLFTAIEFGACIRAVDSDAIILNCSFTDNETRPISGQGSDLRIEGNFISRNVEDSFGSAGIDLDNCSALIINNEITHNRTEEVGGGISLYGDDSILRNNVIAYNQALRGAGIAIRSQSTTRIENCQIQNNTCFETKFGLESQGAGIYSVYADPVLGTEEAPNSISNNDATIGADIYLLQSETQSIFCDLFTIPNPDSRFLYCGSTVAFSAEQYTHEEIEPLTAPVTIEPGAYTLAEAVLAQNLESSTPDTIYLQPGVYGGFESNVDQPSCIILKEVVIIGAGAEETELTGFWEDEDTEHPLYKPLFRVVEGGSLTLKNVTMHDVGRTILATLADVHLEGVATWQVASILFQQGGSASILNSRFETSTYLSLYSLDFEFFDYSSMLVKGVEPFIVDRSEFIDIRSWFTWSTPNMSIRRTRFSFARSGSLHLEGSTSGRFENVLFDELDPEQSTSHPSFVTITRDELTLRNCTLFNIRFTPWYETPLHIENSIFANTNQDQTYFTSDEPFTRLLVDHSFVQDGSAPGETNLSGDAGIEDLENYTLTESSICVDAGSPDVAYNDREDPDHPGQALAPARGTVRNDMGAYGGPYPLSSTNTYVTVEEAESAQPVAFTLLPAYPNPFNNTTTVHFYLPASSRVRVAVYDLLGRQVALLADDQMTAGDHSLVFEGKSLASGIYFLSAMANGQQYTQKLVLLK